MPESKCDTSFVELHDDMLIIPFRHKREMSKIFRDVLGLNHIHHIDVCLVSPDNKMTFYSSNPALIINLVNSGLWSADEFFSKNLMDKGCFFSWNSLYHPDYYDALMNMKLTEFGYEYGFCLARNVDDFLVTYSFATKKTNISHEEYYKGRIQDMLDIGDFVSRKIEKTACLYHAGFRFPGSNGLIRRDRMVSLPPRDHLHLVVDNTQKWRK